MKFREHRGGLQESLDTTVEIGNTFSDVCEKARDVLAAITPPLGQSEVALPTPVFLSPCVDPRIGWDGYFVHVTGWGIVGLIDGLPEGTDPESIKVPGRVMLSTPPEKNEFDTSLLDSMYPHVEGTPVNTPSEIHQEMTRVIEVTVPMGMVPVEPSYMLDEPVGLAAEEGEEMVNELLDEGLRTMGTYTGADWFATLKAVLEDGDTAEAIRMIDSIPTDLQPMNEVAKGMVVLPDAEHMSEAMVDSTRGMHLYYMEAGSGVTCEQMRKHLSRYAPWAEKHYPQWFRDDNSHLTKAGRAILAHALTIGAHKDPDAREYYFKPESIRRQRVWDNPMHQRIRLTFKPLIMGEVFDDGGFVIHKRFLDARPVGNDRFVLQLNRSDMPKVHRGKFKTEAFTLALELTEEGMNVNFLEYQVNSKLTSSSYEVIPAMASRW
jgi:hypothetical protein